MASENESFESAMSSLNIIADSMRISGFRLSYDDAIYSIESARDRIKAAHRREIKMYADKSCPYSEPEGNCKLNFGKVDELCAKEREVVELRECLNRAIQSVCEGCTNIRSALGCTCEVERWRKVLNGEKSE